jgi:hypothetical protein
MYDNKFKWAAFYECHRNFKRLFYSFCYAGHEGRKFYNEDFFPTYCMGGEL